MTIDWTPHPEEPGTVLASVDGVNRGYVRQSAVIGWYGRTDYGAVMRPDDGTEAGARARVEDELRRVLKPVTPAKNCAHCHAPVNDCWCDEVFGDGLHGASS